MIFNRYVFIPIFIGLLAWGGILAGCGKQEAEQENQRLDEPPLPSQGTGKESKENEKNRPSSLEEKIKASSFHAALNRPYRLLLYYAFLDTPDHRILGHYFKNKLTDILPVGEGKLFLCMFELDAQKVQALLNASSLEEIESILPSKTKENEMAIGVCVSLAEKEIKIKSVHRVTHRISPLITMSFRNAVESLEMIAQTIPSLLGLEGYILETDEKNVTLVFRGGCDSLCNLGTIQPGSVFWLMKGSRRIRNSLVFLKNTLSSENYMLATGEYHGSGIPQPGLKAMQVYFTGGTQHFKITDEEGTPQAGFSVFSSYEGFSTQPRDYKATTDASGEFLLEDSQKKPIFLVIARNVEGINFAFEKKIVVVEDSSQPLEIKIASLELAIGQAQKIAPEQMSQKNIQDIKRRVHARIEEAKEYIKNKEMEQAILAVKLAKQHLQQLSPVEQKSLLSTLEKIEAIYQQSLERKKAVENYVAACKLLEEADSAVGALQYEKAQGNLQRANELWDLKYYAQEYKELKDREKRLAILIQQKEKAIGKAREEVANRILKMEASQVNEKGLKEIQTSVETLFNHGEMDKNERYNDLELWLKLCVFLNDLSEKLANQAQVYLEKFNQARSEKERTEWFQKHQSRYQCSQTIDRWLKTMRK